MKRRDVAAIVKTDLRLFEVVMPDGQRARGYEMVHHWRMAGRGTQGTTTPVVLSLEAVADFVQQLQQALQIAATTVTPPNLKQ